MIYLSISRFLYNLNKSFRNSKLLSNSWFNIILKSTNINCCNKTWNIPITSLTVQEIAAISFEKLDTGNVWKHLTDPTIYNSFYGCTTSYILEYPFSYQYYDEIVQNIKDYTKSYKYLPSIDGVFNSNRKIQTNDYFNQAILYNDVQSSGVLNLIAKPSNNLASYLTYPKYNSDSKDIVFTKADNFYQFNTFWDIVIDKTIPLFVQSCSSLSIDKEVNQDNMNYGKKTFNKDKIRAKDLRVRLELNNTDDVHLVSQIIFAPSQISYR